MSIPARFPFAYTADVRTARGFFDNRVLVDTVDIDVPTMADAECPVVMTWRTSWDGRRPGNAFVAEHDKKTFVIRHRGGRFYSPVEPNDKGLGHLSEDHLPRRERHGYGAEGSVALGNLYDRYLPGGESRVEAVKKWLTGDFKRQPTESDILSRAKSDYLTRKAEAKKVASRLMVIGGVLHVEVCEPKFVVGTTYFNNRNDMPRGATCCPLVAILLEEAKFGARLPHFGMRRLDAKEETRTASMRQLDELIAYYDTRGTPILLHFDDLEISDDVEFEFDGELNRRWRVVCEVVSMLADQVQMMPEAAAMAWMRLRRVAAMREADVTREAVDDLYEDVVGLVSSIDVKDMDRQRLLDATEWWNDAPIKLEMGHLAGPAPR
ncbi:hypothetical protein [Rhizobium sp. BK176]|uniref:hypothetical protein n=1 Tax=Rhizobium sp. BK176 TaxID=2587071 RepID=UPI00216A0E83|nr:hypothetical protein [Rhizobium sp. BK176]MCS4089217.1 hypothetical protein [Rhizobium sp. BK176]